MPVRHGGSYVRPSPQPEPPAETSEPSTEAPVKRATDLRTDAPSSRQRRGVSTKD